MSLERKLKSIMRQKADVLGLRYRDIRVADENLTRNGVLLLLDNPLSMHVEEDVIVLKKGNLSGLSSADLDLMLENLACNAKDAEEGISGYRFVSNLPLAAVVAEIHQAYADYFSAQRHIRAFGMDRFRRFQLRGMNAFVQRVERYIEEAPTPHGKADAIASYYKEQIKDNLLDDAPAAMPPVVQLLIGPFAECFDHIRGLHGAWPVKMELLYLMATILHHAVDVVRSYEHGQLLLSGARSQRQSSRLHADGSLSLDAFYFSSAIEDMMIDRYTTLARQVREQLA